jgi:hypothetical protein
MATTSCLLLLLAAPALNPMEDVAWDQVDLVEINHFYDPQGRLVFDQIIFYDWSATQCRFNVRAWRLLKKPAQVPLRNWRTGKYEAVWHDGGVLRKVEAASFRESWTQRDPELEERAHLPKNQRRELLHHVEIASR